MATPSLTASQALLDLVLDANQCSDYRAAQLFDVQKATVSKWRVGRAHMGNANIEKACELAKCQDDTWYWVIIISAEREKGPDGECFRTAAHAIKAELEGKPRKKTGEKVLHALAARALKRKVGAASVILMGLFVGLSNPNKSLHGSLEANSRSGVLIMRTRKRRTKAA